jgi:tetratricopeptide (TPR) repeat protein
VKVIILICFLLSAVGLQAQFDSTLAISISPSPTKEELYNRGLVFYKSEQFTQALPVLDSCLALDSSFADARLIKALVLEKTENLDEALSELQRIKSEQPGYPGIDKRIQSHYLTVYLSKYWYYMLAILLITVLIITLVGKSVSYKKM